MKLRKKIKDILGTFLGQNGVEKQTREDREPQQIAMDNKLLTGKNVLITGAGQNIGRSIAYEMAKQGANIFFADIDPGKCKRLEGELEEYQIRSKGFLSDVSKPEDIDRLCESLRSKDVAIDILVNNVGIQFETEAERLEPQQWRNIFDTNVIGPTYLTKCISDMMMKNKVNGSIIFITSIHQWTVSGLPSYSSSKAALGMIVKEFALAFAPYKIRVNGIAPGWIDEDEHGRSRPHDAAPLFSSSINPRYIGRAAVYLASSYFSKFTTGTIIKIDAGLSLHSFRTNNRNA